MSAVLKKYWFLIGLAAVFAATILDPTDVLASLGRVFKQYHGPDVVIFLVFLFSGILLDPRLIRSGLSDITGSLLSLILIFAAAPLVAALIVLAPVDKGVAVGLLLVAVMPTTLSSGVVMSGAAGGNQAHALFITILANVLCMFTIPATLPLLLNMIGIAAGDIVFDRLAVMTKIALYVLVPLCLGLGIKYRAWEVLSSAAPRFQIINQFLILCIVWMGVSQAKQVLYGNWAAMFSITGMTLLFHLGMLACAFSAVYIFSLRRGRMEQVVFMGSQKTLPLSIILQVTLFPQYGHALMVCVLHHLVSLLIDGFLVGRLGNPDHTRYPSAKSR